MSGANAVPLKPLPALGYYAGEYAFAITNLSIISSDNEIDFLDLSVTEVGESTSLAEAKYLESNLRILDSEIHELEQASYSLASLGTKWLKAASKHPTNKHHAEVQKKNQLDSDHDTAAIQSRAAARLHELREARSKLDKMCTEARKTVESRDSQTVDQRGSLPRSMDAFKATSGSFTNRQERTAKVNGDPDASAYSDCFFIVGELERLFESTTPSGYSSAPSHRSAHASSVLHLSDMIRKTHFDMNKRFGDTHSSQRKLAQAVQSLKEYSDGVSTASTNQSNYAAKTCTQEHTVANRNGQYYNVNNNSSCKTSKVQGLSTETMHLTTSQVDYHTEYAASVRQLFAMLSELEESPLDFPTECSETSKHEVEQVIQLLKQATDRVSATATRWMGDAAAHDRYQAERQTLQTARKKLSVVSLQRQASAKLQELRKYCRNYDHTRREPLRYDLPTDDTNSSGGDDTGDITDPDASAHSGSFFVNGELERLIGSTPASSKPLKLVGQAIEKFDGDITKYPVFHQQFLRESLRSRRNTDDVDRFYILLSLLDGPAKQLVSGINPLNGFYQLATSTFDQRYGDENEIYGQLLRALKQLKPLQHGCSATQIGLFSMKVVQTLASIADLGRADTSGRTLEEVEEKLPPSLREKIHERKRNDPHWDITKLHAFLLERAAISRAIHGDKVSPQLPPDFTKVNTAATAAQQRQGQNRTWLCNERHHICFCTERYLTDKKASKTHATTHKEVYGDYEEPASDSVTEEEASSDDEVNEDPENVGAENHNAHALVSDQHNGSHQSTLLECVEVTVAHSTDKTRRCQDICIFDSCSAQAFIQQSLREKLQLPQPKPVNLSSGTFRSSKDKAVDTSFTQLKIRLRGDVKSVFMKPQQVAELREGTCAFLPPTETPEILVGRDLRHLFQVTEEPDLLPSGFVLSHTNVGCMVVGLGRTSRLTNESEVADKAFFTRGTVIESQQDVSLGQLLHNKTDKKLGDVLRQLSSLVLHADAKPEQPAEVQLESILQQLHSLEQLGVETPDAQNEDDAIHKRIHDSICWFDGRYEVGLPWRTPDGKAPSNADLPDNVAYAFECLRPLIKTLSKSPELLAVHDKIFKEYLASGTISEVAKNSKFTTHYLSHNAVIKKTSETTKTRPVHNGSATPGKGSLSLNDWLHKGPLQLNPITAVLPNSRLAPYVLSADIERAFLQVSVREEDRQVCRFPWVRDTTTPATGENLVIYCFHRVIFGLRPSRAGVTIEHHVEAENTALSREILANCYIDNIYLTADDIEEPSDKYSLKQMFANINMNMREFATNVQSFNVSLPKEACDGFKIEAKSASITDANLCKAYEIDGRVIMASSGYIPLLDNRPHVDEVASYAETRRATPPTYATWSRDEAIGQFYRFGGYINVFCRPDTFLSEELVRTASESTSCPFDACLGACVGVHLGNSEDWHQRTDMRQQLASILLHASIGQYHIVGLGECGLDYTKKAPVRNADGSVKMRDNGSTWLSHSTIEKRKHQIPVLEGQLTLAKQLVRPDGRRYPLVLHLRVNVGMNTDVQHDALEAMAKVQLSKDSPIHFHFWSGDLGQYKQWIEKYPQTFFGINSGPLKRRLTQAQVEFLHTVSLSRITFELDAPHHSNVGTSQSMGTPAGLVWAIKKFKELGSRPEDAIAQKAMENAIHVYRPDLHIVTLPVPDPLAASRSEDRQSVSASSANRGPVTACKSHTLDNRPDIISDNTYTMFELTAVSDAECVGPHFRCTSVHLVSDGRREGTILSRDWNHVLTGLTDLPNLRNSKVFSIIQIVLCCWAGRLLRDRPQEMMQFLQELLGRPAQDAAKVLDRWYEQITASSGRNFRRVTESDVELALRKRFHGCRVAHSWLKKVHPPFRYECQTKTIGLQQEVQEAFATINRLLPDALAAIYHQFATRRSSVNDGAGQFSRYHDHSSSNEPDTAADLQLVEDERYDEDDQPGSSQHAESSGSGPSPATQRRFSQMRAHRGAQQ